MNKIFLILSFLITAHIQCFENSSFSKIQAGILAVKNKLYSQTSKNQALQDAITQRDYTLINYWFVHGADVSQATKDLALEQATERTGRYTNSEVIFWQNKHAVLSQTFKDAQLTKAANHFWEEDIKYWLTQGAVLTQDLKNQCLRTSILKLNTKQIRFWLGHKADFFKACADLLTLNKDGGHVLRIPVKSSFSNSNNDSLVAFYFVGSIFEAWHYTREAREIKNLLRVYEIDIADVLI